MKMHVEKKRNNSLGDFSFIAITTHNMLSVKISNAKLGPESLEKQREEIYQIEIRIAKNH